MADALGAGQQGVGKLLDLHAAVTRHILEPLGGVARGVLDFQHFHAAPVFVMLQHRVHVGGAVRSTRLRQVYSVFQRQLGAAADGEVGSVRRVAHQHDRHPFVRQHLVVYPGLAHHPRKADPVGRAAQVAGVADQGVAVQVSGKQALAESHTFLLAHVVQPVGLPDRLRRLDNKRRRVFVKLVGVGLEPAVFGLLECKGEGIKGLVCAEPDEAALPRVDVWLVGGGVTGADAAVQAIAGDHQVGPVLRGQGLVVRHIGLEHQFNTHRHTALLQDIEQVFAPDAAEPVAARAHTAPLEKNLNVVPVVQRVAYPLAAHRVGSAQVVQRLVRQHHTPAKGVERFVALHHHDTVGRVLQLHQQTEIQARRTTTDTQYIHEAIVYA